MTSSSLYSSSSSICDPSIRYIRKTTADLDAWFICPQMGCRMITRSIWVEEPTLSNSGKQSSTAQDSWVKGKHQQKTPLAIRVKGHWWKPILYCFCCVNLKSERHGGPAHVICTTDSGDNSSSSSTPEPRTVPTNPRDRDVVKILSREGTWFTCGLPSFVPQSLKVYALCCVLILSGSSSCTAELHPFFLNCVPRRRSGLRRGPNGPLKKFLRIRYGTGLKGGWEVLQHLFRKREAICDNVDWLTIIRSDPSTIR